MLTITFVRHGESMDNLRTVWAGWADAPLSNHGMSQARAAGEYFSNMKFDSIYTSPLKRAHQTAEAILATQPEPRPSFTVSSDVREQHFGIAEGKPWSLKGDNALSRDELYARGVYPVIYNREDKFPDGESLNDVQIRAERAVEELVMPNVRKTAGTGRDVHVAVVSHGLCISELIAAVVRKDRDAVVGGAGGKRWTGLLNTAWTRVTIEIPSHKSGEVLEVDPADPPPLVVKVTHINQHSHLDKVKRQQGGIGSSAFDPKQKDIRAFFGGATLTSESESTSSRHGHSDEHLEEGRAASNVFDETEPLA